MRVAGLRKEVIAGQARVAAVTWEERDHSEQDVYVECPAAFGADLIPNPDAFLLACVMPAMDFGERRVEIEGAVCPSLRNGVRAALSTIIAWFPDLRPPALEPTRGFVPAPAGPASRVASFMSGGVDALATLRTNRLDFPIEHPAFIRDGLMLFGFNTHDFGRHGPVPERVADFERRFGGLSALAREARLTLIPVSTNVRFLANDFESWNKRGMGAGLAAVAHCFASRIGRVLIGSSGYVEPERALGTHPLLDPHYGSARLDVRQDGLWLSRLEKTRLIAEWPEGFRVLHCCQQHEVEAETLNCGRCNKCLRTMIHLAALGRLDGTRVFPAASITAETIAGTPVLHEADADFLGQSVAAFRTIGRDDLARAVETRLARYHWHLRDGARPAWLRAVRRAAARVLTSSRS